MSAVEIVFLAIGLCLGIAVGAAILDLVRARPAPREVRLTITHNALPAREAVAVGPDAMTAELDEADRRVGFAVAQGIDPAYAEIGQAREPALVGAVVATASAGRAHDEGAMSEGRSAAMGGEREAAGVGAVAGAAVGGSAATGAADPSTVGTEAADASTVLTGAAAPGAAEASTVDPCAAQRHLADERCAVAAHAKGQAEAAATNLQHTRRAYDDVARRIDEAQRRADPRAVEGAKEEARGAFRAARDRAASRADLELAATVWLSEINRINIATRDATMLIAREQADAATLLASIDRQALDADAARITAEAAQEACADAQAALAACAEGTLDSDWQPGPAGPALPPGVVWDREDGRQPEIVWLLRGETAARQHLIAQLTGPDPDEQRRYQIWLSELVDAIFAASIEVAVLDFPAEHPFWSGFERSQCRDIVVALASLGYRFDGMGGFASDRIPGQRELSLAVGYAALDPMRIRNWPTAAEMPALFAGVTVAADEFLATRAPDLELSEMVAILGLRSERLTELWNRWPRVRPLLLEIRE